MALWLGSSHGSGVVLHIQGKTHPLFPRAGLLTWVWLLILKQHCDPALVLLSCSVGEVLPTGTWLEACFFMPAGGRPAAIGSSYGPCDSVLAPINCSPRPILSTQKSAQCPVRSPPRDSMRTTFIYISGNRSTIYGPRSKLSSQLQSNRRRSWVQSYIPRDHIEFTPAQGPGDRPGNTWLSSTWLTAVPETISSFWIPDRRSILPAEISLPLPSPCKGCRMCLFLQMNRHQHKTTWIIKTQANMTPPQVTIPKKWRSTDCMINDSKYHLKNNLKLFNLNF